ncbi:MAG: hypothetical protein HQM12_10380 [SAR324 cluster bacterium]|nr:hypothetical protein [SAR324 cluster bacterium]
MPEVYEILTEIQHKEVIAKGKSVKIRKRLDRLYGTGNWVNKGFAKVRLSDGTIIWTEVHWFEAHGMGKVQMKTKP